MTILPDGSGQIVGMIAEKEFALDLMNEGIAFSWVGSQGGHYDFVCDVGGRLMKIDVKCKKRNVPTTPDYDAHVNTYQKDYDCHVYVFTSVYEDKFQNMGWCMKPEFWDTCRMVEKGQADGSVFKEHADSGKLKYSELRPIDSLYKMLKTA